MLYLFNCNGCNSFYYILGLKYRIFATLIWTLSHPLYHTLYYTFSEHLCTFYSEDKLDLFIDAYLQFELWDIGVSVYMGCDTEYCHVLLTNIKLIIYINVSITIFYDILDNLMKQKQSTPAGNKVFTWC